MPSFLPSFPSTNFYRPLSLNRVLLFPRWSFYARRGRKRRKKSRGRKNHGEAISRKRPSVTCHSRDYTIIAFPFHDQIYEYEMRTIFFNKCEFPPCSQIIIQTSYRTEETDLRFESPLNGITTKILNTFQYLQQGSG